MLSVIQTIPSREELARAQVASLGLPCEVYVDTAMEGPFKAFIKTLKKHPSGDDYRFHMQDDLILSDGLGSYLPELVEKMKREGMEYLSFYSSPRKVFKDALADGSKNIITAKIEFYLPLLCAILSPSLVERLLYHEPDFDQDNPADDMYLASVMKHYKWKAYYHIPSLAQHDIRIKSSIGFRNNYMRQSAVFDKDFVLKNKQSHPHV